MTWEIIKAYLMGLFIGAICTALIVWLRSWRAPCLAYRCDSTQPCPEWRITPAISGNAFCCPLDCLVYAQHGHELMG